MHLMLSVILLAQWGKPISEYVRHLPQEITMLPAIRHK